MDVPVAFEPKRKCEYLRMPPVISTRDDDSGR